MTTIVHSAKVFNDGVIEAEVKTKTSLGMGVHVTGLSGTEIINGVRRLILTLPTTLPSNPEGSSLSILFPKI